MDVSDALSQAVVSIKNKMNSATEPIILDNGEIIPQADPLLATYFQTENIDTKTVEKMQEIREFLDRGNSKTEEEVLEELRSISAKMGADAGRSLDRVYQYVVLSKKAQGLTAQIKALEQ